MSRTETKNVDKDLHWGFQKTFGQLHLQENITSQNLLFREARQSSKLILFCHVPGKKKSAKEVFCITIIGKYSIKCAMGQFRLQ